jgi:FkbM family methyltransferase
MRQCVEQSQTPVTAFDVGANIGVFALELSAAGFDSVHAFEPVHSTFMRLVANVGQTNIKVVNAALGAANGPLVFAITNGSPATNHSVANAASCSGPVERVAVLTLDEYCAAHAISHIDLLKIDVEGMEPCVLRGARELMTRRAVSRILIEICPQNLIEAGTDVAEFHETIVGLGYAPFELLPDGSPGRRLKRRVLVQIQLSDILLLPVPPDAGGSG